MTDSSTFKHLYPNHSVRIGARVHESHFTRLQGEASVLGDSPSYKPCTYGRGEYLINMPPSNPVRIQQALIAQEILEVVQNFTETDDVFLSSGFAHFYHLVNRLLMTQRPGSCRTTNGIGVVYPTGSSYVFASPMFRGKENNTQMSMSSSTCCPWSSISQVHESRRPQVHPLLRPGTCNPKRLRKPLWLLTGRHQRHKSLSAPKRHRHSMSVHAY